MLDVTPSDISNLGDEDLRELVVRLCEAELRGANLPVSALTAGGHQNASDGGLDVRVRLKSDLANGNFIPRSNTGFQVKVPDMPRYAILEEMAPGGNLRPVVAELAEAQGAYIIVSSKVSTSDSMLKARIDAMAEAISRLPNRSQLYLDFYDCDRIARWTRAYPGISAWVREKVGRSIRGWQAYRSWTAHSSLQDDQYLIDDRARIRDGRKPSDGELSAVAGIERMRDVLAQDKGVVRLIGLSGLGKTRLVQALFDAKVGVSALDPALVIYTDVAHDPRPSPRDMLQHLVSSRQRAIVVVDNCKPETHKALVAACGEHDSRASLITVEYDVGEDAPEDTTVFRLEPASDDIIEKLIEIRFPHVSQLDRRRLVESSGGNARVALALAHTVRRGDQVAKLADRDLFARLFHQGNSEDRALLRAAEACSLVYSFDGETTDNDQAELAVLAHLAGQSVSDLYRHVAELRRRELVQRRGKWRAVLPHALANKLAAQMLESSAVNIIESSLTSHGQERLAKSFARRLGYLHDSEGACNLAESWLRDGGLLGSAHALTPLGWAMFEHVAPLVPETTLQAIERSLRGDGQIVITDLAHPARRHISSILRSLAYDASLFDRSAGLLRDLVLAEPPGHNRDSASGTFNELFRLYLSGTHATLEQRMALIGALVTNANTRAIECGLDALDSLLHAGHFTSSHRFEFGARSRNHGWTPRTIGEVADWYRRSVDFLVDLSRSTPAIRDRLRSTLATNLRTLWSRGHIHTELASAVHVLSEPDGWIEGWLSVKEILRFDKRGMPEQLLASLLNIEEHLRPTDLVSLTHAYALSDAWKAIDGPDDNDGEIESESVYRVAERRAVDLGKAVAEDPDCLKTILSALLSGSTSGRRSSFGRGLAHGAVSLDGIWTTLTDGLRAVPKAERNVGALIGFLAHGRSISPEFVDRMLDVAVDDELLGFWFPNLQSSIPIDDKAADRLIASLRLGRAPIYRYGYLPIWGDAPVSPGKLAELLDSMSNVEGGVDVAIETLHMHLYSLKETGLPIPPELIACGRRLLEKVDVGQLNANADYRVGVLTKYCLEGADGAVCATTLCNRVLSAASAGGFSVYNCNAFLNGILERQPYVALDVFLGDEAKESARWLLEDYGYRDGSPLDAVPTELIVDWANKDPAQRFTRLAQAITLFKHADGEGDQSLTTTSIALLDASPDKSAVLSEYEDRLRPMAWSGSITQILSRRGAALEALATHDDLTVAAWAIRCRSLLLDLAKSERDYFRADDEGFE